MKKTICFLLALVSMIGVHSQNPVLPPYAFIPDGEPHLFTVNGEKRLFIYGSRDERLTGYCGFGHDVWSAPANDLTRWTNHGEIFNVKQITNLGYGRVADQCLYAPDCVYNPVTRKYYLYVFLGKHYKLDGIQGPHKDSLKNISTFGDLGPNCFVAQSDFPYGPFTNPIVCDWPSMNSAGAFDPSVLVVDQPNGDVRVWAYWGHTNDRWAEIDPKDMHTIINPSTRKPDRNAVFKVLNNPKLNNHMSLFEASSVKQVDKDKFVFIFSPRTPSISELTYCYSNSPEGPWTYGGPIINNNVNWKGGNNHGSIVQVENQWYVVYHRQAPNSYNRQAMIEPIDLKIEDDRVIIPPVSMTSQGVLKEGLPLLRRYYAGIACHIEGKAYLDGKRRVKDGYNPVVVEPKGAVIGFKNLNFGTEKIMNRNKLSFTLNAQASEPFMVSLEVQPKGSKERILIKSQEIKPSNKTKLKYSDYVISIDDLDKNMNLNEKGGLLGSMPLFVSIRPTGNQTVEMKEFEFKKRL